MSGRRMNTAFKMNAVVVQTCVLVTVLVVHICGSPVESYHAPAQFSDRGCQRTQCTQRHQQLICNDCIPRVVLNDINEIFLTSLHGYRLVAHGFCDVSWPNVKILSIYNNFDEFSDHYISDYAFACLNRVESLRLSINYLSNLTANTFYGLDKVRCIDLTDCHRLETTALIKAFSSHTILSKLNKLTLSNVGGAFNGIQLSQDLIDALAQRNITDLNLSSSYIEFQNVSIWRICETLQIFNVSKARILYTSFIPRVICDALQIVDFSETQFPQSTFMPDNVTMKGPLLFDAPWFKLFSRTQVLYFNLLLSPTHYLYFLNSTITFAANNSITEFHLGGYNIPICEVEIIFRPNHLTYLDLSNNRIERIGSNTFRNLAHLKKIDLSNNKLGIASKDPLKVLFRNNIMLARLNLAYCELTCLPEKVFEFNVKLEQIDLRGNRITQIHFEISNHTYLMYIDLRNNLIEYLDDSSRQQLDTLYTDKQTVNAVSERNESIVVDMRNNQFSCKCHSLDFIVWFVNSPIFKDSRSEYYCEIDNTYISMDSNAITAAQYDCDEPARKLKKVLISSLVPCITLVIAITVSLLLFKRYQSLRNHKRLRRNIALILEETSEYRFPVFLSYASLDSVFVAGHVHQPLMAHMNALTGAERDLVAIGDRHFRLGRSIFAEIIRLLEDCAVVVIVLSTNYCNSEYCKHEIEQARLMRKPIVVIMRE